MASLAKKFPKTKFIKSIASLCIKDFPAAHLPTIFVYHEGVMKSKFVGQKDLGGGNHFTAEGKVDFFLKNLKMMKFQFLSLS